MTAHRTRRASFALTAVALGATALSCGSTAASAPGAAEPAGAPAQSAPARAPNACDVGDVNNGRQWEAHSGSGHGSAEFHEDGEWFRVADLRDDGSLSEIELQDCHTGVTVAYYDSGPGTGDQDHGRHGFDWPEGMVVIFGVCVGVCDKPSTSCGDWVRANA